MKQGKWDEQKGGAREERKEERMSIHQYSSAAPVTLNSFDFSRRAQQEVLMKHRLLKLGFQAANMLVSLEILERRLMEKKGNVM